MSLWILFFLFLTLFFFGFFILQWISGNDESTSRRLDHLLGEKASDEEKKIQLERRQRLSDVPFFERILLKIKPVRNFQIWLRQSGLGISPGTFILSVLFWGSLPIALFVISRHEGVILPILVSLMMGSLPIVIAMFKRADRKKKFSAAFPDAVSRMASSLRAGYSLQMALESVIENLDNIVGYELKKVITEMEVGQSFEVSLKKMLGHIDTPDLRLFIASVTIQRESGGNLAELLDHLEATIRERFQLQRELGAASAQARLSGIILSLLPIFVGFFVYLVHPDYMMFLFEDEVGRKLLWISVTGQTLGILCIRKIVKIEI